MASTIISANFIDPYGFRVMFDILRQFGDVILQFRHDGIIVEESLPDNRASAKFVIFAQELDSYVYDQEFLGPVYAVKVSSGDIFDSIKGEGKKEGSVKCYIDVNEDMSNRGLHIRSVNIQLFNFVRVSGKIENVPQYRDYLNEVYGDSIPNARLKTSDFTKTLNTLKNRKCGSVSFILNENGQILIDGQHENSTMVGALLPTGNTRDTSVSEEIRPSGQVIQYGGTVIRLCNYKVVMDIQKISWIIKVKCLGSLIIKIYMKPDCPVIMTTNVSQYGRAIFSFNSDLNRGSHNSLLSNQSRITDPRQISYARETANNQLYIQNGGLSDQLEEPKQDSPVKQFGDRGPISNFQESQPHMGYPNYRR